MGCDLEDVLAELKEFKNMALYWFTCLGFKGEDLNERLDALEKFLRDKNEENKP